MDDMYDLKGQVAIVTGGNGGIGFGIASGLARAGASVIMAARNREKTAKAVAVIEGFGVKAMGISTDVEDESSVRAMVAEATAAFGVVDILVNNAGIGMAKPPQDFTLDEWNRVINTNLTGAFLCSREVYPHMVKAGGGRIINIGSMYSIFGSEVAASYAASKAGVVQLTKSLALAWAKDNIRVNCILPGWIHTDLTARARATGKYEAIDSRIPLVRWGEPDDLAGAAVFLSSRASGYVTGVSLPVDGGYSSI